MQIVIDIDDEDYKRIQDIPDVFDSLISRTYLAIKNSKPLLKGHGRIGDLSELETRIGNFIEHYNNLLKETNPEALVYINHILDGIIDTDTIIEADKEGEDDRD